MWRDSLKLTILIIKCFKFQSIFFKNISKKIFVLLYQNVSNIKGFFFIFYFYRGWEIKIKHKTLTKKYDCKNLEKDNLYKQKILTLENGS